MLRSEEMGECVITLSDAENRESARWILDEDLCEKHSFFMQVTTPEGSPD